MIVVLTMSNCVVCLHSMLFEELGMSSSK